jgi:hypothetical protein
MDRYFRRLSFENYREENLVLSWPDITAQMESHVTSRDRSCGFNIQLRRGRAPLPQGRCLALCRQREWPERFGRWARHS